MLKSAPTIITHVQIDSENIDDTTYYRLQITAVNRGLVLYHAFSLADLYLIKRKIEEAIENV